MGRPTKPLERLAIVGAVRDFCERETLRLLPLVEKIARRSKLPDPPFAFDDLVQVGALAVFEHLPKFDPRCTSAAGQPVKVESWLYPRIWGAMQDHARNHGRFLHGGARTGRKEHVASLQSPIEGDHGNRPLTVGDVVPDPRSESPDARATRQAAWKTVLATLNQRERILVLEYFVHGRLLREIAQDLGLSESRCSQMLSQILAWLRRVNGNDDGIRQSLAA